MTAEKAAKVFISYSWVKEKFVLELATKLVEDGVDVVLDKWDLKEGHDKYAFMERCVFDNDITKVLIVSDKSYTDKADSRVGGVGNETGIISSEIYGEMDQERFIPIVLEKNENGEAILPIYLKSRIYIDLSNERLDGDEYKRVLRSIYNIPEHKRPELGEKPDWLNENSCEKMLDVCALKMQNVDGDFVGKLFDDIERQTEHRWGYSEQDYMSPITKGNVVMIAGTANAPKSAYVQHIVNWNISQKQQVVYFSTMESSGNIMYNIIAENSNLNKVKLKRGRLTKLEWEMVALGMSDFNTESLKIISAAETPIKCEDVIAVVEESGASIVVIDDLNGLLINQKMSEEEFMYKLKWAAGKSGAIILVVYNMTIPESRPDQRPMVQDFPKDCYYRLCDIVHFLHRYSDDYLEEHLIEVIIAKGAEGRVSTIKMAAPLNLNKVVSYIDN